MAMDPSTVGNTASIRVNNAINVLNNKKASAQCLDEAIRPFAAIRWAREVLNRITIAKMNPLSGAPEAFRTSQSNDTINR